ncbi:hypothetical protein M1L60_19610 [Actinoplanes sp. TRM 88003]|uniref:Uncharacterized protein n=1 Tax=Paractinoplanes aksuensis TaxID=2939490 RepID=A0ABT1DPN3_9ACTN|nr:hypothetical protein [Actinoplanes aksuensis]MCO8272806.1 hypothetical protein [Actinoplanes aksuensis]
MRHSPNGRSKPFHGGEGGSRFQNLFAAPSVTSERLTAAGLLTVSLSLSLVLVVLLTAFTAR